MVTHGAGVGTDEGLEIDGPEGTANDGLFQLINGTIISDGDGSAADWGWCRCKPGKDGGPLIPRLGSPPATSVYCIFGEYTGGSEFTGAPPPTIIAR